eukprot:9428135-Karenia_brevis.AAC.1
MYPVNFGNKFRFQLKELALRQPNEDSIKSTKSRYTRRNTSDESEGDQASSPGGGEDDHQENQPDVDEEARGDPSDSATCEPHFWTLTGNHLVLHHP